MEWKLRNFDQLTNNELHGILRLRSDVFIVEQDCAYADIDGLDLECLHLFGVEDGEVVACIRLLPPGLRFEEPSLGRFAVKQTLRRRGLGRDLLQKAIDATHSLHPGSPIRISGQAYLRAFYEGMGFSVTIGPYDEDGIPHFEMLMT